MVYGLEDKSKTGLTSSAHFLYEPRLILERCPENPNLIFQAAVLELELDDVSQWIPTAILHCNANSHMAIRWYAK